jgi:hypothetical protein
MIEEERANQSCSMPEGKIRGYVIEMPAYGNCTNATKVWSHIAIDDGEGQNQTFFVSIKTPSGLVCPGKLRVVY